MSEPIVDTTNGKVRGELLETGVYAFKGIRYGASTEGTNRFMPPKKPEPWAGVRDALKYGASAPQSNPGRPDQTRESMYQTGPESEDCLFLNVWTQGINDGLKRPVMFWLHGGGFAILSGSAPAWNGANLARRGAVVVTINHRLAALGYTHFGDIGGKEYASSGNVGMLDAILALEWTRDNIEKFGGDPKRVMIFGESGGGAKVSMLLGCAPAKGLFHSAAIESGAGVRMCERDYATNLAERLLAEIGLKKNQLPDIHKLPVEKILGAQFKVQGEPGDLGPGRRMGFAPVVDGSILPAHPFYPTASKLSANIPVIVGYNKTESTFRLNPKALEMDDARLLSNVTRIIGDKADEVIDIYRRIYPEAGAPDLNFLITTDFPRGIAHITIAERKSELNKAAAYHYRFDYYSPYEDGRNRAPHGCEIPYVFDNTRGSPMAFAGGTAARTLAHQVAESWIALAETGDPNTPGTGLPIWRPYTKKDRATMLFDAPQSHCVDDPIREARIALDKIFNA